MTSNAFTCERNNHNDHEVCSFNMKCTSPGRFRT